MHNLTVLIPCYNEENTLAPCVERLLAARRGDVGLEIIIVDDCSRDNSRAIAEKLAGAYPSVRLVRHEKNRGKGAAIHTGIAQATGQWVTIQDADLEYDPLDLMRMLDPVLKGEADVVYGSRFLDRGGKSGYTANYIANWLLTAFSNLFSGLRITDMETCYKLFPREVIQSITLKETRFGFEPEVTAQIALYRKADGSRLRVAEVPISYAPRTYEEGKKIRLKDGLRAVVCIVKYSLLRW